MDSILIILCILFVIIEMYYWLIYFPRAWDHGSNREIEDMKYVMNINKEFNYGKDSTKWK